MDRATVALILSIIAFLLAISKWIYDAVVYQGRAYKQRRPRRGDSLRVEPLQAQTNCFITRGGYLLFLVSFRIHNDSDQAQASVQECRFQAKIGRKWRRTELYDAPQARIFPSLIRNNLPLTLEPEGRQDFYEVFALDELIPGTEIKIRLEVRNKNGKVTQSQSKFTHRVDERPVFDMLFRILE